MSRRSHGCPFQDGSLLQCSSIPLPLILSSVEGSKLKFNDCTCDCVLQATAQAKGIITIASMIP